MKFEIYVDPSGRISSMNIAGATTGDGMPMTEFHRMFDDSEVLTEFEIPDSVPPEVAWEIAKTVYNVAMEAVFNAQMTRHPHAE